MEYLGPKEGVQESKKGATNNTECRAGHDQEIRKPDRKGAVKDSGDTHDRSNLSTTKGEASSEAERIKNTDDARDSALSVCWKTRSRSEEGATTKAKDSRDNNEDTYLTCGDASGVLSDDTYLTCGSGLPV